MSLKPATTPILLGHRVRHRISKRLGFVVGEAERTGGRHALLRVTIESSTRTEHWPDTLTDILPKAEQFPARGGSYKAPAGYPLYLPAK